MSQISLSFDSIMTPQDSESDLTAGPISSLSPLPKPQSHHNTHWDQIFPLFQSSPWLTSLFKLKLGTTGFQDLHLWFPAYLSYPTDLKASALCRLP